MYRLGGVFLCCGLLAGCAGGARPPDADMAETPSHDSLRALPAGVTLIGLDGGDLEGLLGRPALVRSERQAQYWRYSLGACQLDLFLYAASAGAPSRVVYLDVRPTGYPTAGAAAPCGELAGFLRGEPAPRPAERPESGAVPVAERS